MAGNPFNLPTTRKSMNTPAAAPIPIPQKTIVHRNLWSKLPSGYKITPHISKIAASPNTENIIANFKGVSSHSRLHYI